MYHQHGLSSFRILLWILLVVIVVNVFFYSEGGLGPRLLKLQNSAPVGKWKNRKGIVHVVFTRFMQAQPHLTELGRARLEMLKSVTLQSLLHQTTSEFLWIIRTDPQLEAGLLGELKREVDKLPNAVLILSNVGQNDIRQNVADVTPQSVVAGSYDLVMSYHLAAQSRLVLETQLDADDALSVTFLEYLQDTAAEQTKLHNTRPYSWMVFCSFDSIEWQMFNPWDAESKEGVLVPAKSSWCLTPGMTKAFYDEKLSDLPNYGHVKLSQVVGRCNKLSQVNCIMKLPKSPTTITFRSRTPTSHGMRDVYMPDSGAPKVLGKEVSQQKILAIHQGYRNNLKDQFGIVADDLVRVRTRLMDNISAVVSDAHYAAANCTNKNAGVSCKKTKKEKLENLLTKIETTEKKNKQRPETLVPKSGRQRS